MSLHLLGNSGKTKIGCLGMVILIVIGLLFLGKITNIMDEHSQAKKKAQEVAAARLAEEKRKAEFLGNIEEYYQKLLTAFNRKQVNEASNQLQTFKKYNRLNYKDVAELNKKIRTEILDERVKKIPASMVAKNLHIYKELLALNPGNQRYESKVTFYQAKVDEEKRRKSAERKKYEKKLARFGVPPEPSAWDGSYRCVKKYVKEIAKDPDSLKFEKWSKVFSSPDGWLVLCQFRGKNSFGGYVRNVKWFVIRHNQVVAMKDADAYSIN